MDQSLLMFPKNTIDIGIETAQAMEVKRPFKNSVEEWEQLAITTKNNASYDKLKNKYLNLYFIDTDIDENIQSEVRRIIDFEWKERVKGKSGQPAIPAQYQAVCMLVEQNGDRYEGDEELEAYLINEGFH